MSHDGQSRQAKTDFIVLSEPEVYEPGRYSEDPLSSKVDSDEGLIFEKFLQLFMITI